MIWHRSQNSQTERNTQLDPKRRLSPWGASRYGKRQGQKQERSSKVCAGTALRAQLCTTDRENALGRAVLERNHTKGTKVKYEFYFVFYFCKIGELWIFVIEGEKSIPSSQVQHQPSLLKSSIKVLCPAAEILHKGFQLLNTSILSDNKRAED